MTDRAAFYVDGFNLFHAIEDLNQPKLKWLDLWALGNLIIPSISEVLVNVVYCSAFATHMPRRLVLHRDYVAALKATGVECVMGNFKKRPPTSCNKCGHSWRSHEEKESDVSLAIRLIDDAHLDAFDHAYLVTADSDLAAAVRLYRKRFPSKKITTVAPPGRRHAGAIKNLTTGDLALKATQLEKCLFPEQVTDQSGRHIVTRPSKYDP